MLETECEWVRNITKPKVLDQSDWLQIGALGLRHTKARVWARALLNLAASANRSRSSGKLSSWPRALENSLGCWKPAPPLLLPAP
jgi:hypothetical protein